MSCCTRAFQVALECVITVAIIHIKIGPIKDSTAVKIIFYKLVRCKILNWGYEL